MNDTPVNRPHAFGRLRGLLLVLLTIPFLFVGIGYVASSGIVLFEGGFIPRQVYSFAAPDGRSHVVVTKRVAFPANEFVDPSIVVTVELRESHTDRVLMRRELTLSEDSDLREPSVEWTHKIIRLEGIDSRRERTIEMPRSV